MLLPLLGVTYLIGFTVDGSIVMKYIYVFVNDGVVRNARLMVYNAHIGIYNVYVMVQNEIHKRVR